MTKESGFNQGALFPLVNHTLKATHPQGTWESLRAIVECLVDLLPRSAQGHESIPLLSATHFLSPKRSQQVQHILSKDFGAQARPFEGRHLWREILHIHHCCLEGARSELERCTSIWFDARPSGSGIKCLSFPSSSWILSNVHSSISSCSSIDTSRTNRSMFSCLQLTNRISFPDAHTVSLMSWG